MIYDIEALEEELAKCRRKYCCRLRNVTGEPTWNPDTDLTTDTLAFDKETNILYFWFEGAWHSIDVFDTGIAYQDIPHFQTTVYRDGDEGYRVTNGLMDLDNPDNPLYTQKLDLASADPFNTLFYNNAFGTKDRF